MEALNQLLDEWDAPEWLSFELAGNPAWRFGLALAAAGLAYVVLAVVRALLRRRAASKAKREEEERREEERREDGAEEGSRERLFRTWVLRPSDALGMLGSTGSWFLVLLALFAGSILLEIDAGRRELLHGIVRVALVVQGGLWVSRLAVLALQRVADQRRSRDPGSVTGFTALEVLLRAAVWVLVVLLALANVGVDVTGLVAGLGIGGIAIALAVQNVLGDLFASLSIVLDKPFEVGDFIIVGDMPGTVEKVGLKTTRVRSLSGEQLVFSNGDLLGSRIRNYKRMWERRVVFTFGVVYQTPADTLEAIPGMVREAVESRERTRFDRAHFKGFGPHSLDFEVVYFMLVPDYVAMMDVQQAVNLELVRRFEESGIEFAYPTQTLYVRRADEAPAS